MPLNRNVVSAALVALAPVLVGPLAAQSATLLRVANPSNADRMVMDSSGTLLLRGPLTAGLVQNPGATGPLLMWYPRKAAIRAGAATGTEWNDTNVGQYSAAFGYNTGAGNRSFAAGDGSSAGGSASAAFGHNSYASGINSFAAGDGSIAGGVNSVAIGTGALAASLYSVAIGRALWSSTFTGTILLGDGSTSSNLVPTANNEFSLRAAGGVRLFTNSAMSLGVFLTPSGSSWTVFSDRHRKTEFLALDGESLLERVRQVPVSTWRYIDQEDRSIRHIGPMAQDFQRAFGLNADSTTINMSDLDGVSLAAVQALLTRTDQLRAENADQAARLRALEAQNAALLASLERLEASAATARQR